MHVTHKCATRPHRVTNASRESSLGSCCAPKPSLSLRLFTSYFCSFSLSLFLRSLPFSWFVSSVRAVVVGDRPSGWFSGLLSGIIALDTKIADSPNAPNEVRSIGKENVPLRRCVYVSLEQRRLVLFARSILAINFFMLPLFSRFLPTFLSLSLSLADCVTLCRRQAVWPVHSSVASSVLSLSLSVFSFLF